MKLDIDLDSINLHPMRPDAYPYKRFARSAILAESVRKVAALETFVEKVKASKIDLSHREGKERYKDIVDEESFESLLAQLTFLRRSLSNFHTNTDSFGIHQIKTCIKELKKVLESFQSEGVRPIFHFANTLSSVIENYDMSHEVEGYWIDIFGYYNKDNVGGPIFLITDEQQAVDAFRKYGYESSRAYKVHALIKDLKSRNEEGYVKVMPHEIFSISSC